MSPISTSDLFKRQITLSEIGEAGQQKLQELKVLVVGCGGLGSPIAVYLGASGIGKLHLIDFDTVDITNLHRQVFYSLKDIGKFKSECLSNFIKQRAPFTEVSFSKEAITKENVIELISEYDIVLDGTDNFGTKFLINDISLKYKKFLVTGAISKFDGHVFTFDFDNIKNPCLRCFYREETISDDILNCEYEGILGTIAGIIGTMQANEILKKILNIGKNLNGYILILDLLNLNFRKVKFSKRKKCICN